MLVTSVTVSFQETHSLPDYCNVKPMLSMTAQIGEADPADVIADLTRQVQGYVHGEIDAALERVGKAALYDTESVRVDMFLWDVCGGIVVLLPHDLTESYKLWRNDIPGLIKTLDVYIAGEWAEWANQRHERAWGLAQFYAESNGYKVLDWSHLFRINADDYPTVLVDRMWDELNARDVWACALLHLEKREDVGWSSRVIYQANHGLAMPATVMRSLDNASREKLTHVAYMAKDEAISQAKKGTTVGVLLTLDGLLNVIAACEAQRDVYEEPSEEYKATEQEVREWTGDDEPYPDDDDEADESPL